MAAADPTRACLAEPGGDPPALGRAVVLIGPEGGWTPEERACGLPTVGLTPTVLRTETAAVAAAILLAGLRSGVAAHRTAAVEQNFVRPRARLVVTQSRRGMTTGGFAAFRKLRTRRSWLSRSLFVSICTGHHTLRGRLPIFPPSVANTERVR